MTTIDVEFADIQPGDLVTLAYDGHEFTGQAWRTNEGNLRVGAVFLHRYNAGDFDFPSCRFIRATREAPKLPTVLGSVILGPTVDGRTFNSGILADIAGVRGKWILSGNSAYATLVVSAAQIEPGWKLLHDAGAES